MKIRGSAQQIAEKYATLARDAQSAGDRVMAENYLQHAEHYNRIIAAAQAQMPIQHFRDSRDEFDDDLDEEREEQQQDNAGNQPGDGQPGFPDGNSPQPVIEGTPAEVALNPEAVGGNGGQRPRGDAERLPEQRLQWRRQFPAATAARGVAAGGRRTSSRALTGRRRPAGRRRYRRTPAAADAADRAKEPRKEPVERDEVARRGNYEHRPDASLTGLTLRRTLASGGRYPEVVGVPFHVPVRAHSRLTFAVYAPIQAHKLAGRNSK